MAYYLPDFLAQLEGMGLYEYILPFLLVFAITFAILEKVQIFGTDKKNINAVIALILGLLFLRNQYLVFLLQRFLPNVSLAIIVFLMLFLLVGIFTSRVHTGWKDTMLGIAFVGAIIVVLVSLSYDFIGPGYNSGYGEGPFDWFFGTIYQYTHIEPPMVIIGLGVFLALFFIFKGGGRSTGGRGDNLFKKLGKELENFGQGGHP